MVLVSCIYHACELSRQRKINDVQPYEGMMIMRGSFLMGALVGAAAATFLDIAQKQHEYGAHGYDGDECHWRWI